MKAILLMGSPRKNGNTASLLEPFTNEMNKLGHTCTTVWLYDKTIQPCRACRCCQKDWTQFGCPLEDDLHTIFNQILDSDLILLATPIYSWYCTAPMKALLDRLVYGMNKFYGEKKGPSLWQGKKLALITTYGYSREKGADLWEEGVKRYCKHSGLIYMGFYGERHMGYHTIFMDSEKEMRTRAFARQLSEAETVSQ